MFRFSIRELMLVTLVIGLGCGWGLDHSRCRIREANWSRACREAFAKFSEHFPDGTLETPDGTWRVPNLAATASKLPNTPAPP